MKRKLCNLSIKLVVNGFRKKKPKCLYLRLLLSKQIWNHQKIRATNRKGYQINMKKTKMIMKMIKIFLEINFRSLLIKKRIKSYKKTKKQELTQIKYSMPKTLKIQNNKNNTSLKIKEITKKMKQQKLVKGPHLHQHAVTNPIPCQTCTRTPSTLNSSTVMKSFNKLKLEQMMVKLIILN